MSDYKFLKEDGRSLSCCCPPTADSKHSTNACWQTKPPQKLPVVMKTQSHILDASVWLWTQLEVLKGKHWLQLCCTWMRKLREDDNLWGQTWDRDVSSHLGYMPPPYSLSSCIPPLHLFLPQIGHQWLHFCYMLIFLGTWFKFSMY